MKDFQVTTSNAGVDGSCENSEFPWLWLLYAFVQDPVSKGKSLVYILYFS